MLRAPIWMQSATSATRCAPSSSSASVTMGRPVSARASASSSSPLRPSPWKEYGELRGAAGVAHLTRREHDLRFALDGARTGDDGNGRATERHARRDGDEGVL